MTRRANNIVERSRGAEQPGRMHRALAELIELGPDADESVYETFFAERDGIAAVGEDGLGQRSILVGHRRAPERRPCERAHRRGRRRAPVHSTVLPQRALAPCRAWR